MQVLSVPNPWRLRGVSWGLTSQGPKELSVLNSDMIGSVEDSLFLEGTDLCLEPLTDLHNTLRGGRPGEELAGIPLDLCLEVKHYQF